MLLNCHDIRCAFLFLFLFPGLGLFGGLVGGQLSGFWLKSQYDKMDPEGKVFNEILEIGKESQNLKRLKCSIGKRLE